MRSADWPEVQYGRQDVGVVRYRVVVLVRRGRPAGVVLGAVLVPARAVEQRNHRRLGGDNLLQRVERGLLGRWVVGAGELRKRLLCLRALEPAVVAASRLAERRGLRAVDPVLEVEVRARALVAP